ncbi:MAG: tRNA (adenosine(37)-N6)-threonylcarbamoyltransferase complex ATPase subunit type 1 TsaE [Firmicutes bacterium]|nr:tRNA (adenosine(37)-N6)-threonylcarbamoyltransferase complex ATPase subunit type 1 TsaE [Bacillota bacterium]
MNIKSKAQKIASKIKRGGRQIYFLDGEMGAGKTTLVSMVLKLTHPKIHVQSPTFTIINQYEPNIFHIDLYRIQDSSALEHLDIEDILSGNNIAFVEWYSHLTPELINRARPYTTIYLKGESQ